MRPVPEPTDARGLALSGGGIRSAAFCLGALQALDKHKYIDRLDYMSTVSGGGYTGSSLTVGLNQSSGEFPFASAGDMRDNTAVGHLRNYSNYLFPHGRGRIRNASETAVIILRGLLANAAIVLMFMLGLALITRQAFPTFYDLKHGSFLPRLLSATGAAQEVAFADISLHPFGLTLVLIAVLAALLLLWALVRSFSVSAGNDVDSWILVMSWWLFAATFLVVFLDLVPVLLVALARVYQRAAGTDRTSTLFQSIGALLPVFSVITSLLSSQIARFLRTSERSGAFRVLVLRVLARAAVYAAALILPLALVVTYLFLSAWIIVGLSDVPRPFDIAEPTLSKLYYLGFVALLLITIWFKPNAYSLHQFYRDRLSKAFLSVQPTLRLSKLSGLSGPYHIINAALNVQGSAEANKRGRNADFFTFTRDFVGSDLTMFGPTRQVLTIPTRTMEQAEPRLDIATAMAISGAAASSNMGSGTIRALSPTLALLNVRLGFWLTNPRYLAKGSSALVSSFHKLFGKFYLALEMFNLLDETRAQILVTDGGHIENLGIYQLLKRGCRIIIAVDAEADPSLSFPSLMRLERYARIDLGVRIDLPWEQITQMHYLASETVSPNADRRQQRVSSAGPHCAVGRVSYQNGIEGVLVYVKSSITGDERDYILDYKRRYPAFPHETTGDQFFSEEQFEAYRALGFHIVDGLFSGTHRVAFSDVWASEAAALASVHATLQAA
jgi:hypothetical protein